MLSHFSHVPPFATLWTVAPRLLCSWDSPGKNTGVGCHALLQEIFLTQGSNLRLPLTLAGGFFTTSTTWEAIFYWSEANHGSHPRSRGGNYTSWVTEVHLKDVSTSPLASNLIPPTSSFSSPNATSSHFIFIFISTQSTFVLDQ